ncbi:MAG TPA: precorrin-3B C(17)-methyltransferase [Acidimicrobiales bacterium]|nr:precorrin-3B C(17)-methyltransferase [Acidimicrobiales bacterium]
MSTTPAGANPRFVSVSVTEAGRAMASRLPYESRHGAAAESVRSLWREVDGLILFLAVGAAVRIIGPLLEDKNHDPAVVCVDESGRWAVPVCGGHAGGANALARDVAALLGAEAVLTTASDAAGMAALDLLPGYTASGDVAGVTRSMLAGRRPVVAVADQLGDWPVPAALVGGPGPERVVVTDGTLNRAPGVVALHPRSLVIGVGCSTDAGADALTDLVAQTLADARLAAVSAGLVATIDRRAEHAAVSALGRPVRAYPADELAGVSVPNPSAVVATAVGTPSVAEAAALLAAGPGAELVVPKKTSTVATVAVARRARPAGRVSLVGLGPGEAAQRTPAATAAVRGAEVVIGYTPYLDQAADLLGPHQAVEAYPIGQEVERARRALAEAAAGRDVAVVCSGDAGVFAMASIVDETAPDVAPEIEIEVVPGVTASTAAAALLGAPLGHDHAVISLSDLLTPWSVIEQRVRAAGAADLVVAFYNPRSAGRTWQLDAALDILRHHRPAATPVGVVTDAYRPGQQAKVTTLADLQSTSVGMTSCVIVGSSTTRCIGGRMVTPRGYVACP